MIDEHDRSIVEDALPRTVEATAMYLRRVARAERIVEYDRTSCVPPKHLHNGGLGYNVAESARSLVQSTTELY